MAEVDGLLRPAQIRRGRGQKLCDLDSLVSILIVSLVGTGHHSTPHPLCGCTSHHQVVCVARGSVVTQYPHSRGVTPVVNKPTFHLLSHDCHPDMVSFLSRQRWLKFGRMWLKYGLIKYFWEMY